MENGRIRHSIRADDSRNCGPRIRIGRQALANQLSTLNIAFGNHTLFSFGVFLIADVIAKRKETGLPETR
jgi:hypothetical protein